MAASKLATEAYGAVAELDKRVSESGINRPLYLFVKIHASQINDCAFCIDLRTREAHKRGEKEEKDLQPNAWREALLFPVQERAALGLTEAVTLLLEASVPDHIWAKVKGSFGENDLANVLMAAVATRMAPRTATE